MTEELPLDRRPWVDANGNRHTHLTKKHPTFTAHLNSSMPTRFDPAPGFHRDPRAYGATDADMARLPNNTNNK